MLPPSLWLLCVAVWGARADDTTDYVTYTGSYSTLSSVSTFAFTGSEYSYETYSGQKTLTSTSTSTPTSAPTSTSISTGPSNGTVVSTRSNSQSAGSHTSPSVIVLGGATSTGLSTNNATISSTSSAAQPVNTVPCNNYPEFCTRKYSNITEVCAHNSAFVVKDNAASNQMLSITDQLNDGIRMCKRNLPISDVPRRKGGADDLLVQGETHYVNGTVMNCHTTCELLNAGTWQAELETLVTWLESNPYDVVTFLIVNSDFKNVEVYLPAIQNSGIESYLYVPDYIPQHKDQWPTLGEMILTGKRVVMFMDYNANQTAVPYILDEFSHIFETPFSPTNQSFPCTQQRPPGLNRTDAENNYMYLANHNLNTAVDLNALTGGSSSETILIPNYAELNRTNGQEDQFGQLGAMNANCTGECHLGL